MRRLRQAVDLSLLQGWQKLTKKIKKLKNVSNIAFTRRKLTQQKDFFSLIMERNKTQVVCFDNDMGDNEGPERGAIAVHDLVIRFDHKEKGQCWFFETCWRANSAWVWWYNVVSP